MKLKYYVLGLVSACAFTSCNDDFLERAPKDQLSDTSYWQMPKSLQMVSTVIWYSRKTIPS